MPGAKTSAGDAGSGDNFADMLASVDAAMLMQGQAMAPAGQAAAPPAAAPVPEESETDTLIETAEIPAAAPPQADARPQPPLPAAKDADKTAAKDEAKDEAAPQAANDNMNAAAMQPMPVPPASVPVATPQDGKAAPTAIAATQPANAAAAAQQAAHDAEAEDASPQAAAQAGQITAKDVTPKQAAGKPAKSDFKKALDETRPTAKSDSSSAADNGKDARPADAKQAGPQTVDARPADMPAQPASHANNNPQPDAVGPAVAATNGAHAANAAPAAAPLHDAAPPAPHHAPNLEDLAVNIAAKSQGGARQFDIRLDPPELGRVEVRLSIDATGKAEAHLTADQPQTLDLLRKDSSSLTQALRDAGLDVNQDGLNFSLRDQQSHAGHDQGHAHGGRAWRGTVPMQTNNETAHAAGATTARALGLLDIKV